jgi:hypothetical protein
MAVDPQYAQAHASLGFSYFMSAMLGLRSLRETMPLIRAEAQEALTLDPSDPGPHILLGSVAAAYDYDWKVARELFETGMAAPSTSPEAHWAYASLYLQPLGRHDESVVHMERAVERDPVNAHWRGVLGSHLTHARRPVEAIRQASWRSTRVTWPATSRSAKRTSSWSSGRTPPRSSKRGTASFPRTV